MDIPSAEISSYEDFKPKRSSSTLNNRAMMKNVKYDDTIQHNGTNLLDDSSVSFVFSGKNSAINAIETEIYIIMKWKKQRKTSPVQLI